MIISGSPYCTEDDLADRISFDGTNLRVDDNPPDILGNVINRASAEVRRYLLRRYSDANLAMSEWISMATADIACYLLCKRRANSVPSSIAEAYRQVIADLKYMQFGQLQVPDVAPIAQPIPTLTNIDMRLWPSPHPRVMRARSTGGSPTNYPERVDWADIGQWGALDWII
jgi:phage gp36-like protein